MQTRHQPHTQLFPQTKAVKTLKNIKKKGWKEVLCRTINFAPGVKVATFCNEPDLWLYFFLQVSTALIFPKHDSILFDESRKHAAQQLIIFMYFILLTSELWPSKSYKPRMEIYWHLQKRKATSMPLKVITQICWNTTQTSVTMPSLWYQISQI